MISFDHDIPYLTIMGCGVSRSPMFLPLPDLLDLLRFFKFELLFKSGVASWVLQILANLLIYLNVSAFVFSGVYDIRLDPDQCASGGLLFLENFAFSGMFRHVSCLQGFEVQELRLLSIRPHLISSIIPPLFYVGDNLFLRFR